MTELEVIETGTKPRQEVRPRKDNAALIWSPMCCHSVGCGMTILTLSATQSDTRSIQPVTRCRDSRLRWRGQRNRDARAQRRLQRVV